MWYNLPPMANGRIFWVSGIDTDIGKTLVTGLMAKSLLSRGLDVITVKMVQTGNVGRSEDIEAHRQICGRPLMPEDREGLTAPQIFSFPSSPLLSAKLEGRSLDLDRIASAVRTCAERHQVVLVESAGGLDVPLTEEVLSADFAAAQGWPLILVTCGRLGAINHALLSLEAAKLRGMTVAGVVHNWHRAAGSAIDEDAVAAIRRHLVRLGYPPVIIRTPAVPSGCPYPDIDFSELFA